MSNCWHKTLGPGVRDMCVEGEEGGVTPLSSNPGASPLYGKGPDVAT